MRQVFSLQVQAGAESEFQRVSRRLKKLRRRLQIS
jgi:hypothetical protein